MKQPKIHEPFTPNEIDWYVCQLLYRCHKCHRTLRNNTKNVVRDRMDHIIMEEEILCVNCGASIDYWATGYAQSDYDRMRFEEDHPKAVELIKKMAGVE